MEDTNSINLEIGQYITDGQNELLVCEVKEYENKIYAYVINEQLDEGYFYKIQKKGDLWEFSLENSPSQIKQLIIHFSNIKSIIKGEKNE